MAKLAALIDGMAKALQVSPSRVRTAAAHLRKHKLVNSGPRGPGAPEMTPRDATNLLLAVLYDGELADAHQTVTRLRNARLVRFQHQPWREGSSVEEFARNGFLSHADGRTASFGEVIETLLDWWVRYGTIAEGQEKGEDDLDPMNLDVEVACPGYRATLEFADPCCSRWVFDYEWKSPEQVAYESNADMFDPRWDARNGPHIWSSRRVGEDCLFQLADCLRGCEWDEALEEFVPSYDHQPAKVLEVA